MWHVSVRCCQWWLSRISGRRCGCVEVLFLQCVTSSASSLKLASSCGSRASCEVRVLSKQEKEREWERERPRELTENLREHRVRDWGRSDSCGQQSWVTCNGLLSCCVTQTNWPQTFRTEHRSTIRHCDIYMHTCFTCMTYRKSTVHPTCTLLPGHDCYQTVVDECRTVPHLRAPACAHYEHPAQTHLFHVITTMDIPL
jgi:hypothetical protein